MAGRRGDHLAQLRLGHGCDDEAARRPARGQGRVGELGLEVRAQGEDEVEARRWVIGQVRQQLQKGVALPIIPAERDQLFDLVHHNQEPGLWVRGQPILNGLADRRWGCLVGRLVWGRARQPGRHEIGHDPQRCVPGPHGRQQVQAGRLLRSEREALRALVRCVVRYLPLQIGHQARGQGSTCRCQKRPAPRSAAGMSRCWRAAQ